MKEAAAATLSRLIVRNLCGCLQVFLTCVSEAVPMTTSDDSRYRRVSRRAMLRASLGAGVMATATACGMQDADVFSGATADLADSTTTTGPEASSSTTAADTAVGPAADPATLPEVDAAASALAVAGEMVIGFTYSRSAGGKIEPPYVAVWIENEAGELLETVALFYERGRRGARWLDHLDRWFSGDAARIASGGADVAATISSATRAPGEYAVAWDGTVDGEAAAAGTYAVYIESAREEGPVSLTNTTVTLDGTPFAVSLPDDGELSLASVRVDV